MKRKLYGMFAAGAITIACFGTFGCGSGMSGTYSDPQGTMVLDLKSGGKASITYAGSMLDCDYSTSGGQLNLNCPDPAGKLGFLIHDDGSLTMTGAGAGVVQTLRRQK